MTLRLLQPLSVVMAMVPRLLWQFRRWLQIKKSIANPPRNLLNSQNILSINNSEKWLVTNIPPTQLKKLLKLHRRKSKNPPMVSFIYNGSGITTWMGHSFKTKSTKSKEAFLRYILFEFQAANHQISTRTLELYANSLKQLFYRASKSLIC